MTPLADPLIAPRFTVQKSGATSLFLAHGLTTHHIGLEETDDGIWSIYFNTVLLAKLDERDYIIRG